MGYTIHFDDDTVSAEELKLIETKKAILEKLRVRFGFGELPNNAVVAASKPAPVHGHVRTHAARPR